jgi:hypothetical protein
MTERPFKQAISLRDKLTTSARDAREKASLFPPGLQWHQGARAMEDASDNAIAIRVNMARLRELRLAKEAEAAAAAKSVTK